MLDYFFSVESGHKDFVRSMIQTNNDQTLITASEDKTIKLFAITSSL
jgi:WD40 repeat protein